MSKINTVPKGLQEFLGNTSQGVNPSELSNQVLPSFDMFKFWALDKTEYLVEQATAVATFQATFRQVPEGEIWIPLNLSYEITLSVAAETAQIVCGIANNSRLARIYTGGSNLRTTTAATPIETVSCFTVFPELVLLAAGDSVFGQVQALNVGAARTTSLKLRFVRLRA
jgi:hypothetical protein